MRCTTSRDRGYGVGLDVDALPAHAATASGCSPHTARASVDFPAPLGPTSATQDFSDVEYVAARLTTERVA